MVPLIYFCHASDESDGHIFRSEPMNVTVMIGETVRFNCSGVQEHLVAVWIIDGSPHDWTDFITITTYTFDMFDNSLTVNSPPKSLNGTSFQCVLDGHRSRIGYLMVIQHINQSIPSNKSALNTTGKLLL